MYGDCSDIAVRQAIVDAIGKRIVPVEIGGGSVSESAIGTEA